MALQEDRFHVHALKSSRVRGWLVPCPTNPGPGFPPHIGAADRNDIECHTFR